MSVNDKHFVCDHQNDWKQTHTHNSNITSDFEIKSEGVSGGGNDGVETLIEFDK